MLVGVERRAESAEESAVPRHAPCQQQATHAAARSHTQQTAVRVGWCEGRAIENAGGYVECGVVQGELPISRSIGDRRCKASLGGQRRGNVR